MRDCFRELVFECINKGRELTGAGFRRVDFEEKD